MLKEKLLSFSIFCLSISVIISAVIIANGMKNNGESVKTGLFNVSEGLISAGSIANKNNESVVYTRNTYDLPTASAYLGITESELVNLISAKDSKIPYIKVGSNYIFSKNALDKWLETARVEIK